MSAIFFFNDTATTDIYTLSLHDALPILPVSDGPAAIAALERVKHTVGYTDVSFDQHIGKVSLVGAGMRSHPGVDRKSTRMNSSHANISYAVFCLKNKKTEQ